MRTIKRISPHIILIIYVVAVLFPFVFVLFSSLKESNIEIAERPFAFPTSLYFQNYIDAWVKAKINVYFFNSIYLATTSAFSGVLLSAATAYALTRMRYHRASKIIYQFVLIGMLIPGNVLFIAQYILVMNMKNFEYALGIIFAVHSGCLAG